jgi:hypothetical protein
MKVFLTTRTFEVRYMRKVNFFVFAALACTAILSLSVAAETATMTATIDNIIPVASSVYLNGLSDITLTANETTVVIGIATISDDNGCEDIISANATLFRSSIGSGAADNNKNHYFVSCVSDEDCELGGTDITVQYTCTFELYWYADATDDGSAYEDDTWILEVSPADNSGPGTADLGEQEVNALLAMSLETTDLDFGVLTLGTNTGDWNANTTVTNYGNEKFDVLLSGYGAIPSDDLCMVCTVGSIPVGNCRYDNQSISFAEGVELTSAPVLLELNVEAGSEGDSSPSGLIYYGLWIPSDGLSGACSGTLELTANPDTGL